ncbi:MAG: metallophosphoesterase [Polyangiaceae bacterium]|nr:metallophosphoesterase [Polyangiaceae bacterium]
MARTIWIGDIHGCAKEFASLLEQVQLTSADQVVLVGDLLARGPDSRGVLALAREVRALAVRGNHEHRMILAHAAKIERKRGPRLGPSHLALLDELGDEDWEQLQALPLSLDFPEHGIRVVHAGVTPGVSFEEQQPWTLLHIRSLTSRGAASDRYNIQSWAASYCGEPHIVFGHNAQAGLQLAEHATGLDTGCVYGGELSALVLESNQVVPPPQERRDCIVSVLAADRYVNFGPRPARVSAP